MQMMYCLLRADRPNTTTMEINRSEYGINMDRAFASKARCKCVIVLSFRMAYTISSSVGETSIDLSHNYNV